MNKEHHCKLCDILLTNENWSPSRQRNYSYFCKACDNQRNKTKHLKLKLEVISAYGGECICCSCNISSFLTIDHMDNSGAKHRKEIKEEGISFYKWLKNNNYPKENFQLLCLNCNCAKYINGCCPHTHSNKKEIKEKRKERLFNKKHKYCIDCQCKLIKNNWMMFRQKKKIYQCDDCNRKYRRELAERIRLEVLSAYGNKCSCCSCDVPEFLTIDHISENGAEHRKTIGNGSKNLYYWLKRNGFPKDNFQILCFNCNLGKHICGVCPCSSK